MEKQQNLWVDAVYVLSVKSFTDRIAHIKQELSKYNIAFEFIFDYDIENITPKIISQYFNLSTKTGSELTPAHQSLILKHITAWQKAIEKKYNNILIFEDDVILCPNFNKKLQEILDTLQTISPSYLVFLGGRDTKVPLEFFLTKSPIFKNPIATTDGYITDYLALKKREQWLQHHLIDLPADHLIKLIDQSTNIDQYWATETLIQQGSVTGLFKSTLDKRRQARSAISNKLHYLLKILRRKVVPKFLALCLKK